MAAVIATPVVGVLQWEDRLSMITPPVCLAADAATSFARSAFMKTGWTALREAGGSARHAP